MNQYGIQLDFDAEFEPPKVYIADRQGMGCCYVEVLAGKDNYLIEEKEKEK